MGILQSDGGVRGKQGQQFDGFVVETIDAITLAVEHAHDLIAHHERNGQFRARGLRGADRLGWRHRQELFPGTRRGHSLPLTGRGKICFGEHDGITGAAVLKKDPVYAPDVSKDPRYICAAQSTRSELAIPLMVRDEVVGVLDCQSDRVDRFDHETIELLTLFSTHASIALQNAHLYSLERQRARQLEAINIIAQQSTAVMELEDLLVRVCAVIQHAFQVPHVSLFLRDEGDLVMRAHQGELTPCTPPGGRFPVTEEPWSRIIETSGPIIEKDLTRRRKSTRIFKESASRMSIPLISFGQTLGVLTLHSAQTNAFRESELQSLESVADICATSIQNAHYVERVKQL